MRRLWAIISLLAIVGALSLAVGCVNSDEDEARTPDNAPTVPNSALQTDSQGNTVTAPASTAPPTDTGGDQGAEGDAAAGKTFFAATCTSCHLQDGMQAGVGPKLSGLGLAADRIRDQVVNGGGAMPAGLASGTDLDNVVAYVLSIQ